MRQKAKHWVGAAASTASAFLSLEFTKFPGNPILEPTQSRWEVDQVQDGGLIKVGDTVYWFYPAGAAAQLMGIGYATADAKGYPHKWTKYTNNPVIQNDSNIVGRAGCKVFKMPDGSFRMYLHSYTVSLKQDVGYLYTATAEGFPNTWSLHSATPLMSPLESGWEMHHFQPHIFSPPWESPDGLWHMLYDAQAADNISRGGHAVSKDGLSWTRATNNPVLNIEAAWENKGIGFVGGGWWRDGLFYAPYQAYNGTAWRIGLVTTRDFVTFTKYKNNPILVEGSGTNWDSSPSGVESAFLFEYPGSGKLDLFYLGSKVVNPMDGGGFYKSGVATAVIPNDAHRKQPERE
jgi:predicted GH43/DUF377 family glycosyl hydrolase